MFKEHPIIRLAVYGVALLAMAASFFMTAIDSPLAPAFVQTANLLGAAAGAGAISNLGTLTTRPKSLPGGDVDGEHPVGFTATDPADEVPHGFDLPEPGEPLEPATDRYADPSPRHAKAN